MPGSEGRRRFRPALWPTVIAVPALAALVALGTWQLYRMEWKEALIAERRARIETPPLTLPAAIEDPDALAYRRARAEGTYLYARTMRLVARTRRGEAGVHLVTPLRLAAGPAILVDRGWAPEGYEVPGDAPAAVTVEGVLRRGGRKGWFTPDNEPGANEWFYVDIPAMAAAAGLSAVAPMYLEAVSDSAPGPYPVGNRPRVDLPQNHLQYALTWYALAVALVAVYVLYHRRRD